MLRGRRGPLIAGAVALGVCILAVVFLVLPKLNQVSTARGQLDEARNEQSTLESQLAALQEAREDAPKAQQTIRRVDRLIPPTVDQGGIYLLLENAAVNAGVDAFTIAPGNPTFDEATGLSTVPTSVSATGTYFSLVEFLYNIETLPRAAKVITITMNPGGEEGAGGGASPTATVSPVSGTTLSLTATVDLYTTDSSGGPGSAPGPTEGAVESAAPEAGA